MDVAERTAYLDAMGVTVWQPRFADDSPQRIVMAPRLGDKHILPAAVFASPADIQVEADVPQEVPATTQFESVPAPVVEQPSEPEVTPVPVPTLAQEPVAVAEDVKPENDPDVAFTVQIQYHTSGIALLDICQHTLGHQRAHQDLGAAIVTALCGPGELENNQFTWPVVNIPRMDRRRSQARASTKAFLTSFAQRCDIETVICTGDSLDIIEAENLNIVRLAFSLTDLLQGHVSKRDAWQQLKGYKR